MVRERAPDRASALPEECAADPEGWPWPLRLPRQRPVRRV